MTTVNPIPSQAVVADIGGTNARFAVADLDTLALSDIRRLPCSSHPNIGEAIRGYLGTLSAPPGHAAIAVSAPVTGETIRFTNSPWSFAKQDLFREAGLNSVLMLNDFEALALSLPHLRAGELRQIGGGVPVAHATKVVLGPGTGLGVAGLVWSGADWVAVPGEGGHVSFGAHDERELALAESMRKGRGHLSVERALSGPGLSELYQAVAFSHGDAPCPLAPLAPHEIVARAREAGDPIAVETLELFVKWLGSFAGDIALVFGARGGVYLGGGIAPKIVDMLSEGAFREAFEAKGRMDVFLGPIPVYVILADLAALTGAAAAMRSALAAESLR